MIEVNMRFDGSFQSQHDHDHHAGLRLLYVALTRAERALFFVYSTRNPSAFLSEIPSDLLATYNTTGPNAGYWVTTAYPTFAGLAGPQSIDFNWQTGTGGGKKSGSVPSVARPFANDGPTDTQSYPIAYAQVNQGAGCTGGAGNSVDGPHP
jgi:hypothetical protein